jgi:hypothetical protein
LLLHLLPNCKDTWLVSSSVSIWLLLHLLPDCKDTWLASSSISTAIPAPATAAVACCTEGLSCCSPLARQLHSVLLLRVQLLSLLLAPCARVKVILNAVGRKRGAAHAATHLSKHNLSKHKGGRRGTYGVQHWKRAL